MPLKIHRVNKNKYQVKDGKKVVKECNTFKQAMNAIIAQDILELDLQEEFCDTILEDSDILGEFKECA